MRFAPNRIGWMLLGGAAFSGAVYGLLAFAILTLLTHSGSVAAPFKEGLR